MEEKKIPLGKIVYVIIAAILCVAAAFAGGYFVRGMIANYQSMTFIDDYGRSIELDGFPERIISVAPTPTEILFAVGAGELVVGVDDYSDYPPEVDDIPKVGSYELNLEAIIGLQPDLVICSDLVPVAQLETIEAQGIPYMILATRSFDDVFNDIMLVGSITDHFTEASALVNSLKERVEAITDITLAEGVPHPRIYLEYYPMWTFGAGSFGQELIKLAGGINIAENVSAEYTVIADEFVVAQDPEIIIYTVGPMTTTVAQNIYSRPGWDQIDAIANGQVYSMDDDLVSLYGPRLVDGLEELAKLIHPELFE